IKYKDEHVVANHLSEEFYTYKAKTGDTAALVLAGLKAKIDANKISRVVATTATNDLVLTGKAVVGNVMEQYQFQYFDVSLRRGFTVETTRGTDALTVTAGKVGNGHGEQVFD